MFDNILSAAALALFAAVSVAAGSSLGSGTNPPAPKPVQAMPVLTLPEVSVTVKRLPSAPARLQTDVE